MKNWWSNADAGLIALMKCFFGARAAVSCSDANIRYNPTQTRRDGRVAEGGGLLNRCRVKSSTGGSNPPLSASIFPIRLNPKTNTR